MMNEPTNRVTEALVDFIADHTPPCCDILRLLSRSMDGKLSVRTRFRIRLHFTICVWCKRYREQLKFLGQYSSAFPQKGCSHGPIVLSDEARLRLTEAVQKEARHPSQWEIVAG